MPSLLGPISPSQDRSCLLRGHLRVYGTPLTITLIGGSGLIGAQALAALVGPDTAAPTDSFTIGVRPFGPYGTDLAQRLAAHVRAWDAAGRPSTAKLRIRAYPLHEAAADPATFVLDKRHNRLLIDW